eukprot:403362551
MNIFGLLLSTSLGILFGLFLAIGINSVLIQISINPFFNVNYGVLFFLMGLMLLYRINSKNKIQSQYQQSEQGQSGFNLLGLGGYTPMMQSANNQNDKDSDQNLKGNTSPTPKQLLQNQLGSGNYTTSKKDQLQMKQHQEQNNLRNSQKDNKQNQTTYFSSQLIHNPQLCIDSCMLSPQANRRILQLNTCLQLVFSLFVFSSSFLCFTLEKDWFKGISAQAKVPSYCLIGVSVAFSFIYTVIDLLQLAKDYLQKQYYTYFTPMTKSKQPQSQFSQQLIITNLQIYLLLSISFIIGALFGAIFGIVDVEDYYKNKMVLYVVLQTEISLCEPIGAVFGGFGGFMLEFLRQQELENRVEEPITQHFVDSDEENADNNSDDETINLNGFDKQQQSKHKNAMAFEGISGGNSTTSTQSMISLQTQNKLQVNQNSKRLPLHEPGTESDDGEDHEELSSLIDL